MIRSHLRSNVVGYLALFVALSGTAVALPATNTVFSDDIVNGQVKSKDISDGNGVRSSDVRDDDKNGGGLAAIDLARGSAGSSEIATDGVGGPEIKPGAVRASEIATDGVGRPEIALDDHSERMLADVEIDRSTAAPPIDSALVRGAFDGGGGSANPARFVAHATCLGF